VYAREEEKDTSCFFIYNVKLFTEMISKIDGRPIQEDMENCEMFWLCWAGVR